MISENSQRYCCEDISKIYGYKEAIADKENYWDCHHCLGLVWTKKQLIEMGLYYNQPAERLMFVTRSEHFKLHWRFDEQRKSKMSGENNPFYGKHHTENIKNTLSEIASKSYQNGRKNPMQGKHHTKETRKLQSDLKKGLYDGANNPSAKAVYQIDKNSGEIIKKWDYMKQASEYLNIDLSSICSCCKGKVKSAGGYIWKYVANNQNLNDRN